MKKKITIIAALAVFALAAAFVLGCIQPIDGTGLSGAGSGSAKPAKGIYLSFDSSSSGRTILPSAPTTTVYDVVFKDSTDATVGGASFPVQGVDRATLATINFADTGYLAGLPAGSYKVEVIAYDTYVETLTTTGLHLGYALGDATHTFSAAIDADTNATFVVELKYYDLEDTSATGIFEYHASWADFVYPPTTAEMAITLNSGQSTGYETNWNSTYSATSGARIIDIAPPSANAHVNASIELEAGYYDVTYTVMLGSQKAYYREVLHIYQNMISTFELIDNGTNPGVGISDEHYSPGISVVVNDPTNPLPGLIITYTNTTGTAASHASNIPGTANPHVVGELHMITGDSGTLTISANAAANYTMSGDTTWWLTDGIESGVIHTIPGGGVSFIIAHDSIFFNGSGNGKYNIQVQNGIHVENIVIVIH